MDEKIFTEHVRQVLADEPYDGEKLLKHLTRAVKRRLQTMGQWRLPPKYLAFEGNSWSDPGTLDNLVQEVYVACILRRLTKIAEILSVSGDIEGLVHKNIQRFLIDRRRKGNPVGRRVFKNVQAASESMIENGTASTKDSRIRYSTIIFGDGKNVEQSVNELETLFATELADADFIEIVCRKSKPSWEHLERTIVGKFTLDLTGYRVTNLVNLFAAKNANPQLLNASFDS